MEEDVINYNDAVYETLKMSNVKIMQYVASSDPTHLLRAIELHADALRLLQNLLMNIEEAKPCSN